MRILYLSEKLSPHDLRFLSALSATEHQIYFLPFENITNPSLPTNITQLTLTENNASLEITSKETLTILQKIINNTKPDLIHAGPIQSIALSVALLQYQPLVTMSWGYDLLLDADKNDEYRAKTTQVLKASKILLCDCIASKEKAISFGFPEQYIVTFPWGVDLNHFSPNTTQNIVSQLGWNDKFILLSTRSWEPIYGVDILAKAFVKIAHHLPNTRLIMLNSGSQEKFLHDIFSAANIIDKVYFAGKINLSDLPKYYCAANLYVSASHIDGSSISLLEAMACGLPVIVSDIPGNKEWVENEKQGWTFKDNDIDHLANVMHHAIENRNKLHTMSIHARKTAEDRADWQKNFVHLLKAYQLAYLC